MGNNSSMQNFHLKDVIVVTPVYNEERNLQHFYSQLRKVYSGDILFIDDGSSDESANIIRRFKDDRITLARHQIRRGYGHTLISAFEIALEGGYEKIITIDSDLQHRPEHIPEFASSLDHFDVVLGSRYLENKDFTDAPWDRFLINRYVNQLINELYGINITDPFCGFRGYRRRFLKKARFYENSYGFALEILMEMIRKNFSFTEIPVEMIYTKEKRDFENGFNDPVKRLLHYLKVIQPERKEIYEQEKIPCRQSAS